MTEQMVEWEEIYYACPPDHRELLVERLKVQFAKTLTGYLQDVLDDIAAIEQEYPDDLHFEPRMAEKVEEFKGLVKRLMAVLVGVQLPANEKILYYGTGDTLQEAEDGKAGV